MKYRVITFFGALFIAITSCKKETPDSSSQVSSDQLKVTVRPTFGTSDLNLDQTVISDEGYAIQFTDIRFYLTCLQDTSGRKLIDAALFDFRNKGIDLFQVEGKPSDFLSIKGYLGVDSNSNHKDPTTFPVSNPLNILTANDMHWDWNPGYIFVKIEARVDTIPDGVEKFNHVVVFHLGGGNLLQNISFSNLNWVSSGPRLHTLDFKLDLQKLLRNGTNTIDVKKEHFSHSLSSEFALSVKVIQNFRDALIPL
jgi:hypothetical protein